MTTTCPNCSHTLRTGAKFCGFCGTDLESFAVAASAPASLQDESVASPNAKKQKNVTTTRRDPWRTVSIIGIVLLVLVIVSALFIQYWGVIFPLLVQFLSSIAG